MKNDNPLSPHIQIYNWHISSLVSISHRITGVINIVIITLICFWVSLLLLGNANYELIQNFFETFFQNDETKIPKEFKKFKVLFHKSNLSRKECILLPFKALDKALKS